MIFKKVFLCIVLVAIYSFQITAFGGGMQKNPFLSATENQRFQIEQAKEEANNNIADPMPGEPQPGPMVTRFFDSALKCTIGELNNVNEKRIQPILNDLVTTTYFRYFKVDLSIECPFWVMDRMCKSGGGCHVCHCDENEVPLPWRVEKTHPAVMDPLPHNFKPWEDSNSDVWSISEKEDCSPDAKYVNLLDNPESNTGYAGDEPRRIWDAIYNENCFHAIKNSNVDHMCFEERVFYRLISAVHTSITAHVFARWKKHPVTKAWIPNQGLWNMVMLRFPDRLDNLYFSLDFMLKSIRKAAPYMHKLTFDTGNASSDEHTVTLINQLTQATEYNFDDELNTNTNTNSNSVDANLYPQLFSSPATVQLKDDLKHMFRNVSSIMNCVGCEKCRVWGKLNVLGIATALKVTLANETDLPSVMGSLQRNEVVAWINALNSFSDSVGYINKYSILQPASISDLDPNTGNNVDVDEKINKHEVKNQDTQPTTETLPDIEDIQSSKKNGKKNLPKEKTLGMKIFMVSVLVLVLILVVYRSSYTSPEQLMRKAQRAKKD